VVVAAEGAAQQEIDAIIASVDDWRGPVMARVRELIHVADPDVVETVKWRKPTNPAGVATFEHAGIICTLQACAGKVKVTFGDGAGLPDPHGVFNASLGGRAMRAIDLPEGAELDEDAFVELFRAAVARNTA
jgi:hypothetical protein